VVDQVSFKDGLVETPFLKVTSWAKKSAVTDIIGHGAFLLMVV